MSIYIFCPICKGNQVYFSNKNNNQEREREKKNPIGIAFTKEINVYKSIFIWTEHKESFLGATIV